MRLLTLIAALIAACAAHAQVKPMVVRPPASPEEREERERDWRERERHEQRTQPNSSGTSPMFVVRPPPEPERDREDERRWRERDERREVPPATKMAPPSGKPATTPMMVVRPAPTPTTPPSKAEEMQRRQDEQRRRARGEEIGNSGSFRCSAYPVCDRSAGAYGSCRGVEQFYSATSERFAREQIARECAALNVPDSCDCAAQCSRVALCAPI